MKTGVRIQEFRIQNAANSCLSTKELARKGPILTPVS